MGVWDSTSKNLTGLPTRERTDENRRRGMVCKQSHLPSKNHRNKGNDKITFN
jgi:hypothetical protein